MGDLPGPLLGRELQIPFIYVSCWLLGAGFKRQESDEHRLPCSHSQNHSSPLFSPVTLTGGSQACPSAACYILSVTDY